MAPLYASTLESVAPVISISCADVMASYTAVKELHGDPASSYEEGAKMTDCMNQTIQKLKHTPCAPVREAYATCLSTKGRVGCISIKSKLEECTAKHIGKLD